MKKCSYCGAEYPAEAVICTVDQTPLDAESPGKTAGAAHRTPQSALGLAITSGLASLFICTAIYFLIGRAMRDIERLRGIDFGAPAQYDVTDFVHPAITWSLFFIGSLCFTFFACYHRCLKESHGIITTLVSLGIILSLTFGPMLVPGLFYFTWLLPTAFIGMSTNSSAGYYVGAALQIVVGGWLLGWFRRPGGPTKPGRADENSPR